jgi:hypothetical protein
LVRSRAHRIARSSSSLSRHGHDLGTGRRGNKHAPLARSAGDASRQRRQIVLTVAGDTANCLAT